MVFYSKNVNLHSIAADNHGFTLLELVIAMTITAVIGVIIASSMSLTIRVRSVINKRAQTDQRARIILDRISKEVASIYLYKYTKRKTSSFVSNVTPPKTGIEKKIQAFDGKADSLKFVSASQMLDPEEGQGGLKEVFIYSGDRSELTGLSMHINENRLNPLTPFKKNTTGLEEIFSEGIAKLSFRYFVLNGQKDIISNKIIYSGGWMNSFGGEKLVEDTNVEETNLEEKKGSSSIEPILSGIEVTLSLYEAEENNPVDNELIVDYPPLFIQILVDKSIPLEVEVL